MVVAGVDPPPVFEAPEHVFDLMALFVEDGVILDRGFAVGYARNTMMTPRLARAARNQSAS
jgi:hypothetical protein